jgi:hypothetical protein
MNPYRNRTTFTERPARNNSAWRYVDEGELVRNQDLWDEAETTRRWIESEQKIIDARMTANAEAEVTAAKAREDAVVNEQFRRRYLSGGGDPIAFERDLPELRREHARRCALGLAEPVNGLDVLKRELKALRGHRLAAPDPR